MFSADDHSGVFSFMVGIIVLVLAGVALSLVVDKRLEFSSGSIRLEKEVVLEASELEGLVARQQDGARHLGEAEDRHRASVGADGLGFEEMETVKEWKSVLEVTQARLRESISKLDKDFAQYRTDYRRRVRQAAIGESLDNIALRNGKEYKQVTIKQVTDVGLEIRHADGIARIQAPDLDQKMQNRFQWNDEDRRSVLRGEAGNQAHDPAGEQEMRVQIPAGSSEPIVPIGSNLDPRDASEAAELSSLRSSVIGWRSKIKKMSAEKADAQSRAGYGNQTSVPGSLETWAARSERVGKGLAIARSALMLAEANLAAVAPKDPLLMPSTRDF